MTEERPGMVVIEVPEALVQPLVGLLDAGLRATGLRAARDAGELVALIDRAVRQGERPAGADVALPPSL